MYLNHVSQQAHQHQQQQQHVLLNQQAALFSTAASSPNDITLEVSQVPVSGHQQSASMSNGYISNGSASGTTTIGGLLAPGPRGQHNRAVSLPAFNPGFENGGTSPSSVPGGDGERRGHQYQASFGGMGTAGFGLAIQGGLNGWVEEEVVN